jgi:hypothetical protein
MAGMGQDQNWKGRVIVVGGLFGAFLGVGMAYLLTQRAERQGGQLRLGAGEGLRLGLLLLGLLKQVSDLGGGD